MLERAVDFTGMHVEVEVWDLDHLNRIIAALRAQATVSRVERVFEAPAAPGEGKERRI